MPGRPLLLACALACGCMRVGTTSVRVHDPSWVALHGERGEVVLPAGAPGAVVLQEGVLRGTPYQILAARAPGGALRLRCVACNGREHLLVDGAGGVKPASEAPLRTPPALVVPYDLCFRYGAGRARPCRVPSHAALAIPWDNVASARRERVPPRGLGAFLVAAGAVDLALAGVIVAGVAGGDAPRGQRLTVGLATGALAAALIGAGLWHRLAPAHVEELRPPP
jgi:hypothetical protein